MVDSRAVSSIPSHPPMHIYFYSYIIAASTGGGFLIFPFSLFFLINIFFNPKFYTFMNEREDGGFGLG